MREISRIRLYREAGEGHFDEFVRYAVALDSLKRLPLWSSVCVLLRAPPLRERITHGDGTFYNSGSKPRLPRFERGERMDPSWFACRSPCDVQKGPNLLLTIAAV